MFFSALVPGLLWICTNAFAASPADAHFALSDDCRSCHDGITDANSNDASIGDDWATGMMANASRDPYWIAKVASELHRNPQLDEKINSTCSRCHAPMANEAAQKEGDPVQLFGSGFMDSQNSYHAYALDGVSCTLCHQIKNDSTLGSLAGFSGNFVIDEYLNPADRPAYGQFEMPRSNPMLMQSQAFNPVFSPHIQDSSLCASCHNLKTPFVDADGNLASTTPESEFPEQMPYTEWLNSDYREGGATEKSCRECHMPAVNTPVKISSRPAGLAARTGFSRHAFLGANTVMMDILDQNSLTPGVSTGAFQNAIEENRNFLARAASLEILSADISNDRLELSLKVNNHSGHKLPTSYPSRRAYLYFRVRNSEGQTLFESGKTQVDGSISGVNTDIDPSTYEPHYQAISSENQVQVYETIMQNTDAQPTHTLLRAQTYIKDNRLTPAGFDKTSVPDDVLVRGAAATDDDFNLGSDTLGYSVALNGQHDIEVDIELRYQALSYGHLLDLFDDAGEVAEVADFQSMFQSARIRSEILASTSWAASQAEETFFVIPAEGGKTAVIPL